MLTDKQIDALDRLLKGWIEPVTEERDVYKTALELIAGVDNESNEPLQAWCQNVAKTALETSKKQKPKFSDSSDSE